MTRRDIDDLERHIFVIGAATALPGSMPDAHALAEWAGDLSQALAEAAPDAVPPEDLFGRIESELDLPAIPGIETIPASSGAWHDQGHGVWVKLMTTNTEEKQILMLRCAPGSRIPEHTHKGWEYALVLEGQFQIAGRTVRAGDAQYSAANTLHPEITSDTGCLLLVVA